MTPNPPIPGHRLLYEGAVSYLEYRRGHVGGCECGARPESFPDVGVNAMKRWHREHKAAIRADQDPPS